MNILFVCYGNICRSPMAEFIMKDIIARRGIVDVTVASAATSDEEIPGGIGYPVYPNAAAELAKHGLSAEGKRAVQITRADYGKYDLILAMETANIRAMMPMIGGDPEGKVHRLLDLTPRPRDVADPWYTRDFATAYADITEGCVALADMLENGAVPFPAK